MWEDVSFVKADKVRLSVLKALTSPKTPKDLAETVNWVSRPMPAVSRALRELREKKLVVCLTPSRRKGKLYELTASGKQALRKIRTESVSKRR